MTQSEQVTNFDVLILGAGAGGITVAASLRRKDPALSIGVVDPSEYHYYQPQWTLVGGGQVVKEVTRKRQSDVIPNGVNWIRDEVLKAEPPANVVILKSGVRLTYKYLIVATGLRLNWEKIEGLEGNLGRNGICSIYEYDQSEIAAKMISEFKGGTAIFVMPPVPIKCAGAPQKIMYLAENIFRNNGIRHRCKVVFATAGKAMFGIPVFSDALTKIVKERGIEPHYLHKLVAVEAAKKKAHFDVTDADGKVRREVLDFDLLHVVPSMSAHAWVQESDLAVQEGDQKGWLAVDKATLQHLKYSNVFGIGDVTGVPNSKTGAAVRMQYPVVVENLTAVMQGRQPSAKYDGYSSCPLTTEIGKVMLAEFGYDGKLMPTFPLDPAVPRRSMWYLKTQVLPRLYWYGMLKGLA